MLGKAHFITMHSNTITNYFLGNIIIKEPMMNLVHVQLASSQSVFNTSSNEQKPSYDPCKKLVQAFSIMLTKSLTTGDSSIFRVDTVMNTKAATATVHKSSLSPSTGHIVQKNGSSSLAKERTRPGNCTCGNKFIE